MLRQASGRDRALPPPPTARLSLPLCCWQPPGSVRGRGRKGAARCSGQGWRTPGWLAAGTLCLDFLICHTGEAATLLCREGSSVPPDQASKAFPGKREQLSSRLTTQPTKTKGRASVRWGSPSQAS